MSFYVFVPLSPIFDCSNILLPIPLLWFTHRWRGVGVSTLTHDLLRVLAGSLLIPEMAAANCWQLRRDELRLVVDLSHDSTLWSICLWNISLQYTRYPVWPARSCSGYDFRLPCSAILHTHRLLNPASRLLRHDTKSILAILECIPIFE